MSEMMDRSSESPDRDAPSPKTGGDGGGGVKQALGVMQSFRRSMRLSSGGKGSKGTRKENGSGSPLPPSPSPSAASAANSPLKAIGGLFQKREEEDSDVTPSLRRSKTDPNMSPLSRSSIRRSLKLGSKKDKGRRACRQEVVTPAVSENSQGEKMEERQEEKQEEEEMEEVYTLPELPPTPLSVMQISKLIEMEVLEEAHLNLLSMRQELQQELQSCADDSPIETVKKEKDLNLLYRDLRNKVNGIVRDSISLPSRNKALLVPVARIIQEEERRADEAGGLPGSWREAWREAVMEGVQVLVKRVHLDQREQNTSWLAVHLGLLGRAIVQDLESVKRELRWSYPPSFRVFSTYVKSYHTVVGQHLKKLELQVTELKDLYSLLDWIINTYKSERIMGNLSLQPEMKDESRDLELEENFLEQLKEKYCCRVKMDMRSSLDKIIQLENTDVWMEKKMPGTEENFLDSPFHMDIWTQVAGFVTMSKQIDGQLEQRVITSCLEELTQFPKRFEAEFVCQCGALRPQPLWTTYHMTYINSFTALQGHMEGYRASCPEEVGGFGRQVEGLVVRLLQALDDQFKEDVKPYLRRMMTRKWLTNDADFDQLYALTKTLSDHCAALRPQHAQELASRSHHHVLREYIGQLMKNNYSCKNRKHEKAAAKIRHQWNKLVDVFEDVTSEDLDWLFPAGDELSDIIGQKNKTDIKDHLQPVVQHYPDFSRKHLVAVLTFRGLLRGREHQLILQRFNELKQNLASGGGDGGGGDGGGGGGNTIPVLFGDMQVHVNTDCLSNLPFSCLSVLLPDS